MYNNVCVCVCARAQHALHSVSAWKRVKFSDLSVGTRLKDSVGADKDVKKP